MDDFVLFESEEVGKKAGLEGSEKDPLLLVCAQVGPPCQHQDHVDPLKDGV